MIATIDVMQAFPTVIGRWQVPDADAMNEELRALILAEEGKYPSLGRSNIGGWHSQTDFLDHPEPAVAALTTWITWAVNQMVAATAGPGSFKGRCPFPRGRRSVAMARTMRRILIPTARGPVCITSTPARSPRIVRSAACWSSSIRAPAWKPSPRLAIRTGNLSASGPKPD